jgi:hypothetical protein
MGGGVIRGRYRKVSFIIRADNSKVRARRVRYPSRKGGVMETVLL